MTFTNLLLIGCKQFCVLVSYEFNMINRNPAKVFRIIGESFLVWPSAYDV